MPNYEFTCKKCGAIVEKSIAITEPTTPPGCEKCGDLMVRSYTFGSVNFSGPGFYTNDKYQ